MKRLFRSDRTRWIALMALILAVAWVAQAAPWAWASPLARPDRQTVPPPTPTPTPKPAPPAPPAPPAALLEITPNVGYAGPGEKVDLVISIHNTTGTPMVNAEITVADVPGLALEVVSADQGEVVTGPFVWRVGTLQPGQVVRLTLRAAMPPNITPDTCLALVGTLVWSGGGPIEAQSSLCAPASILPKTGA